MITFKQFVEGYDDFFKRPRKPRVKRKYKIGHVVKINKPGHPWHGKLGHVLKSKTITAKNASEYAVGIEGSNASERFMEDELDYTKLGYDDFVKGAKLKEPRKPRGRG
jgi:hypothetical protein